MKYIFRISVVVFLFLMLGYHNALAQKIDPLKLIAKHGFANYNQLQDFMDDLPTHPSNNLDKKKFMDEELYAKVVGLYKEVRGLQINDFDRKGTDAIDKALTAGKLMEFQKRAQSYIAKRDYVLKSYKEQEQQKIRAQEEKIAKEKQKQEELQNKIENDRRIMAEKAKQGEDIEKQYSNIKGGWKYLKWGMSLEEAELVCIKNGAKFNVSSEPESKQWIFYDPENKIEAIFKYAYVTSDQLGKFKNIRLYFYNNKLAAAVNHIGVNGYIDNSAEIVRALKESYPSGQIYKKKIAVGSIEHFKYDSKYLKVHTVFIQNMYWNSMNGVFYVDPNQVKSYKNALSEERNNAQKEKESSIRKSF